MSRIESVSSAQSAALPFLLTIAGRNSGDPPNHTRRRVAPRDLYSAAHHIQKVLVDSEMCIWGRLKSQSINAQHEYQKNNGSAGRTMKRNFLKAWMGLFVFAAVSGTGWA